jgi:protein gp37
MRQPNYRNGFALTLQPQMLDQPRRWKKGRRVFVNSMSDLFHQDVPLAYLQQVFAVMRDCPQHQFLVLTKRAERLAELAAALAPWTPNIWAGVSVESPAYAGRIDCLRQVPAAVRFLSLEPLLAALPRLNLEGIAWVIVGAESGNGARPMDCAWAQEIKDQCKARKNPVAFFLKQKATPAGRKIHLPVLDGQQWTEYPA